MKITRLLTITFALLLFAAFGFAQNPTQTIRGSVLDQQSEVPLIGVTVELLDAPEATGTVTEPDGSFALENVPVGRQALRFSYIGYEGVIIPNVVVTAGKEVVLEVKMAESYLQLNEVVVTAQVDKDKAGNELATISARQFSLEEVTRYSGARNDAARMAANFAGVNIADDSRNDIVIRGNSPTGLLWRLDGVAIPNPNHYSTLGTTGGPVSALNTNLLKNSDFLTSAFPAEYGNALSGVFDIALRSGNKENHEYTFQLAAFSGLEAMAEGPLGGKRRKEKGKSEGNGGSYLVSYRHSFAELAVESGINIGTTATPKYKDLSFKVDLPKTKFGNFSLFGIGGLSTIDFIGKDLAADDFYGETDQNSYVTSQLGIIGLTHRLLLNETTYLKTTIVASNSSNTYEEEQVLADQSIRQHLAVDDAVNRYTISSLLNKKYNARLTLRTGVIGEVFNLKNNLRDREARPDWVTLSDFNGNLGLLQAYAQSQYRLSERFTLNAGLHGQYLTFNDTWAVEPRLAVNYHLTPSQTLNLGYGLHSQMQPMPMYFLQVPLPDGSQIRTNENMEFTRSNQFVLGYDLKVGGDWRVKAETYYQALGNVPVESTSGSFSMLNVGADFGFPEEQFLVNKGTGNNYGAELTIEKFFSRGYYVLVTGSVFDSKYKGSDGVERNTAFNNKYTLNFLAGKEVKIGKDKRNALTFDTKFTTAGGRYLTPIDLAASIAEGRQVFQEDKAYSERIDPYLRWDVKFGYRLNSKKRKLSQQFFLDFQNVTNHENVFTYRFNRQKGEVQQVNQIGFFPDVLWRVQF
ncbi:MAG: TonB-dependent receptor [Saprospiraceae bacterium]|nr:TonB-dependent receptor [Saprospiraceae bacterium]MCF8249496.1 TonB-dependent receptor [Saprospiraceae bacterium]MCF8280121.1 TonB-dependent receptor [Bacteroidales bacterium]MCF8310714.1 TonB-dependent receptor [Saprospiraceae bacterium]MCF8439455.1 TonB-dependent receptor [Saprospiraceae bacterium]